MRKDFQYIISYFGNEYRRGRTPNPCVVCNRIIKFGKLWDFAKENGMDWIATGHYAKVLETNGQNGLYETPNKVKDQTYFLAMIKRDVLDHIIFPLGEYRKEQTKEMAKQFQLGLEAKEESQEICFIPDNDYAAMIERNWPQMVQSGKIIDSKGRILGEHNGIYRFTVGQRRGIGVAMGVPYYVTKIDAATNTVTLGTKEEVMHKKLTATDVNWLIDKPDGEFKSKVKIRYNSPGYNAVVCPQNDKVEIEFFEPILAITPGQLAVFYIEDNSGSRVAGGGWIDSVFD